MLILLKVVVVVVVLACIVVIMLIVGLFKVLNDPGDSFLLFIWDEIRKFIRKKRVN